MRIKSQCRPEKEKKTVQMCEINYKWFELLKRKKEGQKRKKNLIVWLKSGIV